MNEKSSPEAPELAQEQDQRISGPKGQKFLGDVIAVLQDTQEVSREELETPRDSPLSIQLFSLSIPVSHISMTVSGVA